MIRTISELACNFTCSYLYIQNFIKIYTKLATFLYAKQAVLLMKHIEKPEKEPIKEENPEKEESPEKEEYLIKEKPYLPVKQSS